MRWNGLGARQTGWLIATLLMVLGAPSSVAAQTLDETGADAAVARFMAASGAPGVAIGIVTPAGVRLFSYGKASSETAVPVDDNTLFELGSVSKTFTVTLAAYAAAVGALRWDDPVSRDVPELTGSRLDGVSLLNLATHTTGGMPLQLPDAVRTQADLMAYFRNWTPPAPPGTVRTYANPSIGLLGVAAAQALHGDFATLVRNTVLAPLGLTHTYYDVPAAEQSHYAQGYTRDGRPVRLAQAPLAAEAYGVRTTAGDLALFVQAQLGLVATGPVLARAIAETHVGYFRAGPMTQALIWEWYPLPVSAAEFDVGNGNPMVLDPTPAARLEPSRTPPGEALVNKTGATNGFGSYVAFIPGRRIGLIILANRNHPTALRLALAEQLFAALGVHGVADQR